MGVKEEVCLPVRRWKFVHLEHRTCTDLKHPGDKQELGCPDLRE